MLSFELPAWLSLPLTLAGAVTILSILGRMLWKFIQGHKELSSLDGEIRTMLREAWRDAKELREGDRSEYSRQLADMESAMVAAQARIDRADALNRETTVFRETVFAGVKVQQRFAVDENGELADRFMTSSSQLATALSHLLKPAADAAAPVNPEEARRSLVQLVQLGATLYARVELVQGVLPYLLASLEVEPKTDVRERFRAMATAIRRADTPFESCLPHTEPKRL